jgi:predicted MFS family arabinose efflux permease
MAKEAVANPAVFGWAWPLFGVAGGVSVLVAGRLSAWFSDRALWAAGSAVMAAGVAVPVVMPGIVGIALSALAVGGTFLVVTVAAMQEARRAAPDAAASLIAAMTAVFALGQIAGPVVAGALVERQGSFAAALVAAALLLGASAWALAPSRRREETRP